MLARLAARAAATAPTATMPIKAPFTGAAPAEVPECRAETFGPVAAIYRCSSADEMVDRANDSEYGLNASVWTRRPRPCRSSAF